MKINILIAVLAAFTTGLITGCTDGNYDKLIEEYNKNFTVTYDDSKNYAVDDYDTGNYDWLLRDLYSIDYRSSQLTIVAPPNARNYEWHIYEGLDTSGREISFSGVSMSSQSFSVYIPNTPLLAKTWYTITLSVTNRRGAILSDIGKIWISNE